MNRCSKPLFATSFSEAPIVVISTFAAVGVGTLGTSRMIDAVRSIVTSSPAVGPEVWRRGIELLPLLLGAFYSIAGLANI